MLEISTSKYLTPKTILVDGKQWTMKPVGAGEELAMSQAQRRIKLLDRKIENGTATDADLDLYDKLEREMVERFMTVFNDGTPDNASVKQWVENTPFAVVNQAMEDIKAQAEASKAEDNATSANTKPEATAEPATTS